MKRKRLKKEIKKLIKLHGEMLTEFDKVYEIFGENKMEEVSWKAFDVAVNQLEEMAGDENQLIGFYIFDCNGGENPQPITLKSGTRVTIGKLSTVLSLVGE